MKKILRTEAQIIFKKKKGGRRTKWKILGLKTLRPLDGLKSRGDDREVSELKDMSITRMNE